MKFDVYKLLLGFFSENSFSDAEEIKFDTIYPQTMFASTEVSQNICRELRAQSFEPQHASSAHPKAKREASFVRQEHHSALSCEDNSEQITLKITESWNGLEWKGS